MKGMLNALLSRPVGVAAGLVAASALIWYLGPLVALGGWRPLAADWARWLAITAFCASAASTVAARGVRSARTNHRLLDGLVAAAPAAAAPGAHEVATIGRRFEEAVALLKASRLGGRRSMLDALAGRPYLYQLPWYIIIGAPGAGKTTALANSGLEFPLASKFGKRGIRGVGGTRNCDWWFTSDAVLIDTAGRFTTQDSDPEADHAAWSAFLDLLRRYRPRRPVNGVLLTVSVSDLLAASAEDRREHARRLRERVDELTARFGAGIPIYVLVTKLDLLAGFMEFFADFDKDERAQVWGVTFPYGGGAAQPDPLARLSSELVALEKRLDERLLERLQGESDRERRAAIFAFPQQWRVLRETLNDFLLASFGGVQAAARPLVRGVYFTSATQEGTPMDRALGSLARSLGLANRIVAPARPSGKTFFVTRLLRDVVFAEAGLAGANLRWQRGRRLIEGSAIAATAVVVALALGFAWRGYRDNRQYLATVQVRVADVERGVATARAAPAADLAALLPVLDALPAIGAPGAAPQRRGFDLGLDQSAKLKAAGQDAYRRLLREALLPRIAVRLQQRLRAGATERVDTIYEALKAYLMLFGGQHFDRAGLRTSLRADWDLALPGAEGGDIGARLRRHFDRLVAGGEVGAPVLADQQLIARARGLVARVALAQRVYTRLKNADPEPGAGSDFTLEAVAGPAARQVFARASGRPLEQGVPALYTRAGFQRLARASDEIVRQLAAESSWVLGTAADAADADVNARARLYAQIEQQYLADYARAWDEFLRDLRIVPTTTLAQSEQVARMLARTDSPLLLLVRAAARELTLEPLTAAGSGGSNADAPAERFAALRRFAAGESAPVQDVLALLGKLAAQLAAIDDAARRKAAAPASDAVRELVALAARSPEPVRTLLAQLATISTGQMFAAQRDRIAQQLASEVGAPCNRLLQGRYPMARGAKEDVSLQDFAQAFAAKGWIDGFFQGQLAPYVDTSARVWTLPNAGGRAEAAATLAPFQQARAIRDAFFHDGGRAFGVRLEFRPLELDPAAGAFELQVNGQTLRFARDARGAAQAIQWPGAATDPAAQRVRVGFTTASGGGALHTFEGPWALFRLFERVRIEPGTSPDRVQATFDIEGRRARFEVRSDTPVNPIRMSALEQFQCPQKL